MVYDIPKPYIEYWTWEGYYKGLDHNYYLVRGRGPRLIFWIGGGNSRKKELNFPEIVSGQVCEGFG